MQIRHAIAVAAILLGLPAFAGEPARTYAVQDPSTVSYKLIHKLHEVVGKAKPSEGKARLLPDGTLQVVVRARVADFDSGNGNRDAHMQEATEAAKFPLVEFKGVATGVKVPEKLPAEVPVTLKGKLTFHGVTHPLDLLMKVRFTSAREVSAEGTFKISLEAFGVERPSLMMVKVDDALVLELKLALAQEGS
jgi:polyisoprenoid-binding protein YceI